MSVAHIDTEYSADSVEFCPDTRYTDLFVCGTYQLTSPSAVDPVSPLDQSDDTIQSTAPHKRLGRCLLYKWSSQRDGVTELQRIEYPAILDMKWSHHRCDDGPLLAIAGAVGCVDVHQLDSIETRLSLHQKITCAPESVLCLSLDWSNRRHIEQLGSIVVSRSDGQLSRITPSPSGWEHLGSWPAHDFEAWIAAWNYYDENVIYSGGDDCKMKGWDIRQGFSQPIFINKRFDAGVTTIQSHPHVEHLLAVGSYDDAVRIFDTRYPLRPLVSVNVGGGAWRVKWHPNLERKEDLAVACMHDGFKVVQLHDSVITMSSIEEEPVDDKWSITTRFDEHASLAYGVDWKCGSVGDESTLIASCSFYDHAMHLWWG